MFAENGFDLVLTARRKDKLNEVADTLRQRHGVQVTIIESDLTQSDAPQTNRDAGRDHHGNELESCVGVTTVAPYGLKQDCGELSYLDQLTPKEEVQGVSLASGGVPSYWPVNQSFQERAAITIQKYWRKKLAQRQLSRLKIGREIKLLPIIGIDYQNALFDFSQKYLPTCAFLTET